MAGLDRTRLALLIAAIAALGAAGVALSAGETATAGVTARVGVILAAVWVAWPSLQRVSARSVLLVGVGVLVLLWRPRAAIVVLPVLAVMTRPRRARR